ncbi:uncharacterized protein LOC142463153 isoform X3 [Ascaphus truei]|uniref:uncharacterized protein LOC142463153 isoform X3 n=1 Tax=Ascaphus truei TaxID=8439 RepID=UPI003F5AD3E6
MAHLNMTRLYYPSQSMDPRINIEDLITSQNIISRVMHAYIAVLVPLGLLAGIFILIIIVRNNVRRQTMENLDFYILNLAVADISIILYSFTAITRPGYLEVTHLGCGTLAFFFNLSYFYSQYLLLLMFLVLVTFNHSTTSSVVTKATQSPLGCVSITLLFSFLMSLLAVSLLGTHKELHKTTHCQLDPLNAPPAYDFVKSTIGFCIPSAFTLLLFVLLTVRATRAEDSAVREKVRAHVVVLLENAVMVTCRLFYNIMLLRRTGLKLEALHLSPREELIMNIAELVVFSGSCVRLMSTLALHRPCRLGVWNGLQTLKNQCGATRTPSSIEM